jgi:hypothetical protein
MTRRFPIQIGVVMAALALMAMAEPSPINADLITVNGRHGLPRADGSPIAARLLVKEVMVAPSVAPLLKTEVTVIRASLRQALEKSLRNHGYLAVRTAEAGAQEGTAPVLNLVVELAELDVQADPEGATVIARISAVPLADGPAVACLPYVATGKFRALTPLKSGGGQRATGIIFGALAGPVGGVFMASQLQNATANNVALNSRRTVAAGEGVSPQHGDKAVARHAAINALQMALVDLVKHLGETEGCKGAAAPVEAASPENAAPAAPPSSSQATIAAAS